MPVASFGSEKSSISIFIPVLCPSNILPFNWSTYNETGIPKWLESNFIEKYSASYWLLPGITIDPSLNIWLPNDSIWSCRIDCKVVNSLAWTGFPGLNNTL